MTLILPLLKIAGDSGGRGGHAKNIDYFNRLHDSGSPPALGGAVGDTGGQSPTAYAWLRRFGPWGINSDLCRLQRAAFGQEATGQRRCRTGPGCSPPHTSRRELSQ